MQFFTTYLWLTQQTVLVLVAFWPITTLLLAFVAGAAIFTTGTEAVRPTTRRQLGSVLWCLALFLIPALVLAVGSACAHEAQSDARLGSSLIGLAFWLHVPVLAMPLWLLPGKRWLVIAVAALEIWVFVWAAFLSSMSVTGDWL